MFISVIIFHVSLCGWGSDSPAGYLIFCTVVGTDPVDRSAGLKLVQVKGNLFTATPDELYTYVQ